MLMGKAVGRLDAPSISGLVRGDEIASRTLLDSGWCATRLPCSWLRHHSIDGIQLIVTV